MITIICEEFQERGFRHYDAIPINIKRIKIQKKHGNLRHITEGNTFFLI
jgi:hypothetical protein